MTAPGDRAFTDAERALVARFESMGENCEFGLLQRRLGVERLGLMRFAGVRDPFAFADAIRTRFAGFAAPGGLRVWPREGEWMTSVDVGQLDFHTGRAPDAVAADAVEKAEELRLPFLADRFLEELEAGRRIFIYRVNGGREGADGTRGMDALHAAMRSLGGNARFLWVTEGTGAIEERAPGLFRGFLPALSPLFEAWRHDPEAWLALLRGAAAVIR